MNIIISEGNSSPVHVTAYQDDTKARRWREDSVIRKGGKLHKQNKLKRHRGHNQKHLNRAQTNETKVQAAVHHSTGEGAEPSSSLHRKHKNEVKQQN